MLKKGISALLCLVLLSSFAPLVCAQEQCPIVFVPGYISARLVMDEGTPNERRVWKQDVAAKIIAALKQEMPGIVPRAGLALAGWYTPVFNALAPYVEEVLEPLRMENDGTSRYAVTPSPHSAQQTRLDALKKIGYYPDHDALTALGERAGNQNVYCCTLDWRLGQIDNAAVLNTYIREVLQLTGAQRVDLMGVSYGGQVAASYLQLYGGKDVRRVVLQCPALDGSSIVSRLLCGEKISVGWADLARLFESYRQDRKGLDALASLLRLDGADVFLQAFIRRFLLDFFLNFGSVWDLVPLHDYAALREKYLLDGAHDKILRKTDLYHTQIAAQRRDSLRTLQAQGVRISIVSGYGSDLAVACGANSDGVIDVASTTGAASAPPGKALNAAGRNLSCLSPDGMVDASTAFLPKHTWFVADLMHGLGMNEPKVRALLLDLLCTDVPADVAALPEYPQFLTSQHSCREVFCAFSACAEGFVTPYSTALHITNVSHTAALTICSVRCSGADLHFSYTIGAVLQPGETTHIDVHGRLPGESYAPLQIEIRYTVEREKYTAACARTQSFRAVRGEELLPVLLEPKESSAPTIPDTSAHKTGKLGFREWAALLWYDLYRLFLLLRIH